jgi:hypothetical protein
MEHPETALDYYDSCTDHSLVQDTHSYRGQLARREQIKTLLVKEIAYLKRLSPDSPGFDRYWTDFKERWTVTLNRNPDIKALDQDSKLGPDQCSLHQMLSIPCGDMQDQGFLSEMKNEAIRGHQVSKQISGLPDTLISDLIRAALLVDSANTHGTAESSKRWYQETFETQPEKTKSTNTVNDYVYGYYPEFEKDPNLVPDLLNALDARYDLKKLRATFKSYDAKTDVSKRTFDITNFLKEKFKKDPLKNGDFDQFEKRFGHTMNEIRNDFKQQIDRGRTDPNWLFDQDYLMSSALRVSASIGDDRNVAFFQTQICHNVRNEHDLKVRHNRFRNYASVGIAIAGTGAVFLSGPVAVITIAASIGMSNLVSIVNIQEAYQKLAKGESLFYAGGKPYTEVKSDEKTKNFAIAQGALNAISGPTMLTLKQLSAARQAAIALGDAQKAESLAKIEKSVLRISNTADASFSGLSLASGDIQGAIFGASVIGSNQMISKFPALKERITKMLQNRARYGRSATSTDSSR